MDVIFLDSVFRVLEKKEGGKKSRLFFECSHYFILFFFVSSLRDTFATSKGDLCERESAHTHTRARKEEEEESRKRLSFRVVVVVVVVVVV